VALGHQELGLEEAVHDPGDDTSQGQRAALPDVPASGGEK
jgi:hypothetical protein